MKRDNEGYRGLVLTKEKGQPKLEARIHNFPGKAGVGKLTYDGLQGESGISINAIRAVRNRKGSDYDTLYRLFTALGLELENDDYERRQTEALPAVMLPLALEQNSRTHNLPHSTSSFIGRKTEIEVAKSLLEKSRLLTLTGSGGCGKTRLSLQVAEEVLKDYPDGTWFVELAPLTDPELVPQTVTQVLGLSEQVGKSYTQVLTENIKSRRLLLILDNCEHLLTTSGRLADELLRACPNMKILASSREGLGIDGEQNYRVPSLSVPPSANTYTPESLSQYEAVCLFIDRAKAVEAEFTVTPKNASALASICSRLDGIPLAIELAAARVQALSLEVINKRLDDRFRWLTGGSETGRPRHQTLQALIDWSYDLLNEQEKVLLGRLSVFAGSWQLEASEQVCTGDGILEWQVMNFLTSLVKKSLVVVKEKGGEKCYRLLETIRQYATEKLQGTGEAELVRQRHQEFYLALAEEAEPYLTGDEQAKWLNRLEAEHDNLRVALDWSLSELGASAGLRFCETLSRFWSVREHFSEGQKWCVQALAAANTEVLTLERAKTLNVGGNLARLQGDYEVAKKRFVESLEISQQSGDKRDIALSLNGLGLVEYEQCKYEATRTRFEESLKISWQSGDTSSIAQSLSNVGLVKHKLVDMGVVGSGKAGYDDALAQYRESLELFRELGDKKSIAEVLSRMGDLFRNRSDDDAALTYYEESLAIAREIGYKVVIAFALFGLGKVRNKDNPDLAQTLQEEYRAISKEFESKKSIAWSLHFEAKDLENSGDFDQARTQLEKSLVMMQELQHPEGIAWTFCTLGLLELERGRYREAETLFGESLRMFEPKFRFYRTLVDTYLGCVARVQGEHSIAITQYEKSLLIFRELEKTECIAMTLNFLGRVNYDLNEDVSAKRQHMEALRLCRTLGNNNRKRIAETMVFLARLAAQKRQWERAAYLLGVAEGVWAETGSFMLPSERPGFDRHITIVKEKMGGETKFVAARSQGRSMTLEDAIRYALEEPESSP